MKLYLISGLGGNSKVFEFLKIHKDFDLSPIEWKLPEQNESLQHYSERMASAINFNEPFIILGYSFGGIIAQEIHHFQRPEKTILVASIKSREELSPFLRFTASANLHRAIPYQFFTSDKILSYTFFRKLYDPRLPSLQKYFTYRNPYYLQWGIHQVVHWNPGIVLKNNIFHIHGERDIVFPIKYIKNPILVKNGTHLMVIQKHRQVSERINEVLAL